VTKWKKLAYGSAFSSDTNGRDDDLLDSEIDSETNSNNPSPNSDGKITHLQCPKQVDNIPNKDDPVTTSTRTENQTRLLASLYSYKSDGSNLAYFPHSLDEIMDTSNELESSLPNLETMALSNAIEKILREETDSDSEARSKPGMQLGSNFTKSSYSTKSQYGAKVINTRAMSSSLLNVSRDFDYYFPGYNQQNFPLESDMTWSGHPPGIGGSATEARRGHHILRDGYASSTNIFSTLNLDSKLNIQQLNPKPYQPLLAYEPDIYHHRLKKLLKMTSSVQNLFSTSELNQRYFTLGQSAHALHLHHLKPPPEIQAIQNVMRVVAQNFEKHSRDNLFLSAEKTMEKFEREARIIVDMCELYWKALLMPAVEMREVEGFDEVNKVRDDSEESGEGG